MFIYNFSLSVLIFFFSLALEQSICFATQNNSCIYKVTRSLKAGTQESVLRIPTEYKGFRKLPIEYYLEYLNVFENDTFKFSYKWGKKDIDAILKVSQNLKSEDSKLLKKLEEHVGTKLAQKHKWSLKDLGILDEKISQLKDSMVHEALRALRIYMQKQIVIPTLVTQLTQKEPIKDSNGKIYEFSSNITLDVFLKEAKLPFYFYYEYLIAFKKEKNLPLKIPDSYEGFKELPVSFYEEYQRIFIESRPGKVQWSEAHLRMLSYTIETNMNSADIDELFKMQAYIQKQLAKNKSTGAIGPKWSQKDINLIDDALKKLSHKPWAKEALEMLREHLKIKLKLRRKALNYAMPEEGEVSGEYFEGFYLLPEVFKFEYLNAFQNQ